MKILNSNIVVGIIAGLILTGTAYPQAQKNIDLLSKMIDKSIAEISIHVSDVETPLFFNYVSPADYIIFKNRCMAVLKENHFNLVATDDDAGTVLNYTLNIAEIKYNETFRDGMFGDYFVEREADIKGSFSLENGKHVIKVENFEIAQTDTVLFDEIKSLSNSSLPFTKAEAPTEPFFASLWEPVIAVGTAIVTIFLFFTIRSK